MLSVHISRDILRKAILCPVLICTSSAVFSLPRYGYCSVGCKANEVHMKPAYNAIPYIQSPPRVGAAEWNIICDFDGTITPFDVTDAILGRFALREWEEIEEEWLQGRITGHDCMKSQVELIRASRAELDTFLDSIPIDESFGDFTRYCEAHGIKLLIVSDGMDYAIRRVLARHNLHKIPVIANRLVFQSGNKYTLEFPFGVEGCGSGVCKCQVAGSENKKVLLIGDGHSDCCLAGKATFTLAKRNKELLRLCEEKGYPCQVYDDFSDICALFRAHSGLPDREEHKIFAV